MLAGGTTDMIAHFAGLLRLIEDAPRPREHYEDPALLRKSQPWLPDKARTPDPDRPLDDLPSRPFRAGLSPGDEGPPRPGHSPNPDAAPIQVRDPAHLAASPEGAPPPGGGGGGHGGGATYQEDVIRDVTPDQELIQLLQVNLLRDDDLVLMVKDVDVGQLHDGTLEPALASLTAKATAAIPAELTLHGATTEDAVDMVLRYEAALRQDAAHGGESGHDSVAQPAALGTYVDGVLQPAGTALDVTLPRSPDTAARPHDGLVEQGLESHTGGNVSVNVASILDDHAHGTALAVRGDAYTTDAIIQINVLASRSVVSAAGEAIVRSIVTDGNETHNEARIADHDTSGLVQRLPFGTHATVDRIDGDFFGVNVLRQANLISDNDTTVQGSFGAYYTVHTGENGQTNVVRLSEIGSHYDLIVVDGDYHSANVIFQTNILLNDDTVYAYTGRHDAASQSISTGGNTLENVAAIDRYGSDTFRPLTATLGNALDGLQDGALPPELAGLFPGGGGPLRVLYITGDFYDINVIAQTNVISDVDGIVQHSPGPGPGTAPDGTPTTSVQSADSGGNHLVNLAGITHVGTTSDIQFVGGTHYDDAILIQANFVIESSQVTLGDTHTLVPEIVAFTGLADAAPVEPSGPPMVTADAHMQQDLFHGVLS